MDIVVSPYKEEKTCFRCGEHTASVVMHTESQSGPDNETFLCFLCLGRSIAILTEAYARLKENRDSLLEGLKEV